MSVCVILRSTRVSQDLIIDAIYAGVIQAKLDQKNERVCQSLDISDFIIIILYNNNNNNN